MLAHSLKWKGDCFIFCSSIQKEKVRSWVLLFFFFLEKGLSGANRPMLAGGWGRGMIC